MKLESQGAHRPLPPVADLRVAMAVATFNDQVTTGLRDGAMQWLQAAGVEDITVVEVPGAFELPLVARRLAATHDAVIALGAVILGETDHYDHVAHRASEGLQQVMLETNTPVAFGVLTVREASHALSRSGPGPDNKGAEAAEAAVRTAALLHDLDELEI
ncbi:MAG TPA: 6,7-dimethyl-8-ribityllumazine synthase [Acidimicrobiia bacterium]|jgi:6,7-dimethyl-8-ribityllumazine synthase|nr:6,7-dimethyl-8-ribityllumazine synthase [Acidimicrobiia bacterium]